MPTSHGKSRTAQYHIWQLMKERCLNPNNIHYSYYGGRGITIYPEWINNFESWYNHVGPRPSPDHTLDRIDNNQGYIPGNVRWASRSVQQRNKNCNVRIDFPGNEKIQPGNYLLCDLALAAEIDQRLLRSRLHYGWTDWGKILAKVNHKTGRCLN